MNRDNFSNYAGRYSVSPLAQKLGASSGGGLVAKKFPKKLPKGKAGLALAGLAAAGGLGVAGVKALKNRNKKANSLEGRVKKAASNVNRKVKSMMK